MNRIQNTGKENEARNDIIDQIELNKSEIIRGIVDVHTINCIFSRSSSFELEEIMDFIMCICKTSEYSNFFVAGILKTFLVRN